MMTGGMWSKLLAFANMEPILYCTISFHPNPGAKLAPKKSVSVRFEKKERE
jgi:hypothetical protein